MMDDPEDEVSYYQSGPQAHGLAIQCTTKIPPSYDGRTSWFAFEDAVLDWQDVTELDEPKRGPALRNHLKGQAATYKDLLDRQRLKDTDGVEYFLKEMRPRFVKSANSVFLLRLFQFFYFRRGNKPLLDWIARFQILTKRLASAWMDLMEPYSRSNPEFQTRWATVNQTNAANGVSLLTEDEAWDLWMEEKKTQHQQGFPINESLHALLFYCLADLSERQRETVEAILSTRGLDVQHYTFELLRQTFSKHFCGHANSLENPNLVPGSSSTQRSFCIMF